MSFRSSNICRCVFVFVFATLIGEAAAQWVRKPSSRELKSIPGLKHETFLCKAMKTQVGYCVVLPPSYSKSKARYPVVYWLHGGGGNETSSLSTAATWQRLYKGRKAKEVILVYPNGNRSGYMDHFDRKKMAETMIIRELIPLIDKRYRTIANRRGRAVHGFSMGASGALKFAMKYPEMFCAAVAYGGGSIDLEQDKSKFIRDVLELYLKSDPKLIRQNNTFHFLKKNQARVRKLGVRFLLVCGKRDSWMKSAVDFQAALRAKKIPCELLSVPKAGHSLSQLTRAQGKAAALFQDKMFR